MLTNVFIGLDLSDLYNSNSISNPWSQSKPLIIPKSMIHRCSAQLVKNQQDSEKKMTAETDGKFLEYAKDWDQEFKMIRKSHSKRYNSILIELP